MNSFSLVGACGLSSLTQNTSLTTTRLTVAQMFSFAVKGEKPAAELFGQTTVKGEAVSIGLKPPLPWLYAVIVS